MTFFSAFLNAREIFIAIVLGVIIKICKAFVQILLTKSDYNVWLLV
jgi:hypothetical protein